ncbi:hypothetical protein FRC01_007240 [Tulasnella sp. 417]|nr:hypothetical protein FRC01_007240 [Tulasnella sp. 417]
MSQHYSDDDDRMSDTDSEVIPSSQPDSSMVYTESQVAMMKRGTADAEMPPQQNLASQPSASGSQRNPMEDQLQANCPICKQKSQVARHNFHLANIIDQFRRESSRVSRRQRPCPFHQLNLNLKAKDRYCSTLCSSFQALVLSEWGLKVKANRWLNLFPILCLAEIWFSLARHVTQKTTQGTAAQTPSTLLRWTRFMQNNKPTDLEEPLLDIPGEAKTELDYKPQSLISFPEPTLITSVLAAPPTFLQAGALNGRNAVTATSLSALHMILKVVPTASDSSLAMVNKSHALQFGIGS